MIRTFSFPRHWIAFCWLLLSLPVLQAQHPDFMGKKLGFYLNGKAFSFDEDYYMWINQFLKVGEDRSWSENVKAELMIRLGERFCGQLQGLTGLDTAIFINGDIERAGQYKDLASKGEAELQAGFAGAMGLDYLLVLDELTLGTRDSKIVYIRSNRFVTQKIEVKTARLEQVLLGPAPAPGRRVRTCFDEQDSGQPPALLDVYREESGLGTFFSDLFSAWWLQLVAGSASNCDG